MSAYPCLNREEIEELKREGAEKEKNSLLSGYTIHERIGKSQFSSVYRATNIANGNRVALKKISLLNMLGDKCREDFLKEAFLLQKMNHPNVIKYLASFVEYSDLVIVLEFADAGDLSLMIKNFSLQGYLIPERTIWRYFLQICCALQYMHSQKVMHRDIKPSNAFITARGVIKLGDLGLGRYFSPETTEVHSLLGTPYYMSPERIKGFGYDFKSDIWSLGCLLYEMAALQSPFHCRQMNLYILSKRIENVVCPPIPSDLYSNELRYLVNSCTEKDMTMRPDIGHVHRFAQDMHLKFEN